MQNIKIDSYRLKICVISSFIFGLFAHAFRYFNTMFSHDTLNRVYIDEAVIIGKYEQGRFFNHMFMLLRNLYSAPWIIGTISILFVALSAYLITDLFGIDSLYGICLISGLFVVNHTLTLINASFIYVADVYMETVFVYTFAAYLIIKMKKWYYFWVPALFVFLGIGAYQSYVPIVPAVVVIWTIFQAFDNESIKSILEKIIRLIITIITSGVFYLIGMYGFVINNGIELSSRTKGIKLTVQGGGVGLLRLVQNTYMYVLKFFLQRTFYNSNFLRSVNAVIILLTVVALSYLLIKSKINKLNRIFIIICAVLLPMILNSVYVLFQGKGFHHLMTYQFLYFYVFAFVLYEYIRIHSIFENVYLKKYIQKSIYIGIGCVIYASILFSNDIYLKKALEYEDTLLVFNRIIERVETTEGYHVDKDNELIFIGNLSDSVLAQKRYGFEQLYDDLSMSSSFSTTTYIKYKGFVEYIMNYPITVVDKVVADEYASKEEVKDMPCFPESGSVKIIDDKIVVKITEVSE